MKNSSSTPRTKGNTKWRQYIEVLWYNDTFRSQLRDVNAMSRGKKKQAAILKLANRYHLPYPETDQFLHPQGDDEPPRKYETGQGDGAVTVTKNKATRKRNVEWKVFIQSHPVNLSISKIATGRDLLDFIKKRWTTDIEPLLKKAESTPPKLKHRPTFFRDFVVSAFADQGLRTVRKMCEGLFPVIERMSDQDLYSLISKEKRRHPERKGPTDTEGQ